MSDNDQTQIITSETATHSNGPFDNQSQQELEPSLLPSTDVTSTVVITGGLPRSRSSMKLYIPEFITSGLNKTIQYMSKNNDIHDEYNKHMLLNGDIPFESLEPKFQNLITKESQDLLKKNQEPFFIIDRVHEAYKRVGVYNARSFQCPIPIIDNSIVDLGYAGDSLNTPNSPLEKTGVGEAQRANENQNLPTVYLNNSLLLPGSSISNFYHEKTIWSKIVMGVKDHYNYETQRHLYLKNKPLPDPIYFGKTTSNSKEYFTKNIKIVSITADLPETYKLRTVGSSPGSYELSNNLKMSFLENNPYCNVETLSISLTLQPVELLIDQAKEILNKNKDFFKGADAMFFIGFYHTVPVVFAGVEYLIQKLTDIEHNSEYSMKHTKIGIWGIESCLSGQTFFEHSSDIESNKKLYLNCSKQEQDILKGFHKFSSLPEFKKTMDWICKKNNIKITLTSKMYDNFMTMSQKLGVNFIHPNIMRNIWVDCNIFDINEPYISSSLQSQNDSDTELEHQRKISIPKERCFEISLINDLILALDLGHHEYASSFLQRVAPFFISRSFNENTYPNSLKKKIDKDTREWLVTVERKHPEWKAIVPTMENLHNYKTAICTSFQDFVDFLKYKSIEKQLVIKKEIYHDNKIYKSFVENTMFTSKLVGTKKIKITDTIDIKDIFDINVQFEVVWRFHEFLSNFIKFNTLPKCKDSTLKTDLMLSVNFQSTTKRLPTLAGIHAEPARNAAPDGNNTDSNQTEYVRSNMEAQIRIRQLYDEFSNWKPSVTGLKFLKNMCSVIEMYDSSDDFLRDISI